MLVMVFYWSAVVTLSLRHAIFQKFDFKKVTSCLVASINTRNHLEIRSEVTQGHQNRHGSICHL